MSIPPNLMITESAATLARDIRSLVGKLKRRLREQAQVGDLTPSQASALLRLEKEGPNTVSGLARAEGMRPQSMATVVAALEAGGFVVGEPDPTDGRRTLLSLTAACHKWIGEGRAARQDWLARRLEERFSSKEQQEVARIIVSLMQLVED
ncbi:MarR family winged helix-turn-helix transcriptional regulator [Acetobacter okinawensis]|uniref:MarR family winged helix-turn-helix transcriptional regulator n=1 Tax=Acetobacter okinawensis TaxID=1076594 RepID=UPI00046E6AE8|nr:MarR family transcriptional regulator [Acetobacter okinawensis]